MNPMRQVIVIHGGDTFDTYEEYLEFLKDFPIDLDRYRAGRKDWKGTLLERLGPGYDVIAPAMPSKGNAKYKEWKLWFDKFVPLFDEEIVLVGHSLGGSFLAKYLAENKIPKRILATFLVAACFDAEDADYSMADFVFPESLAQVAEQGGRVFVYHSEDDPVVPFADFGKFKEALPGATFRAFTDRQHFNQEELPELVADIKALA